MGKLLSQSKEKESDVIWFYEDHVDLQTIYDMIYFNIYDIEFINKYLNSNQFILQALNIYKIFINPGLTALIPVISLLIPFILMKLLITHK